MKFSGKVGNGPLNKRLNFGGVSDHLDTGIVFRIRHYWEIRKVVNGHKSAAHTDSPDGGIGKTCLGGGIHYASASNSIWKYFTSAVQSTSTTTLACLGSHDALNARLKILERRSAACTPCCRPLVGSAHFMLRPALHLTL